MRLARCEQSTGKEAHHDHGPQCCYVLGKRVVAHLVRVWQLQQQLCGGVPAADRHPTSDCQEEEAGCGRKHGSLRRGRAEGHVVQARRQHLDAPKLGTRGEALVERSTQVVRVDFTVPELMS